MDHRDEADGDISACVNALRSLRSDWPVSTERLLIEIHDGEDDDHWMLVAYPMTALGLQAGGEVQVLVPGLMLLSSSGPDERAEFVGRCARTGGLPVLPLHVSSHDEWKSFDIEGDRWVTDEDVWGKPRFSGPPS